MDNIDHPALTKEWKQNIDTTAYEKKLNQDVNIPSIKGKKL